MATGGERGAQGPRFLEWGWGRPGPRRPEQKSQEWEKSVFKRKPYLPRFPEEEEGGGAG